MKSLQQLLETEGSINSVAAMAMPDVPLFSTRRFGGWDEFVVPEDHYQTIKHGRSRMARWDQHLPDQGIRGAVQKSLYRDGCCLITNAKTNLSVMVKHSKLSRQRAMNTDDSVTMAFEATILEKFGDEGEGDFTLFDESQVAELVASAGEEYEFNDEDDEEYIQAYGEAIDQGFSDDEADVFAQIVACFFDNVYSSQDEADTIDSLFNAAVTEVKSGSESLGLNDVTLGLIHAAKKYIEENYDVITGMPTDDGQVEYDVEVDDFGDVALVEAAALAELPTVNPDDQSKDEVEGWAIINMKGQKVIDKPKKGETMEHKNNWLKEYYGAAAAGEGHEVAWVNTKTGVVTKVKQDTPGKK